MESNHLATGRSKDPNFESNRTFQMAKNRKRSTRPLVENRKLGIVSLEINKEPTGSPSDEHHHQKPSN